MRSLTRFLRLVVLAALASGALAACTPIASTPPSDDRQLLPPTGGRVVGETAVRSLFGPFSSLNADCSVASHARVRILTEPRHGAARVVTRQGVASFAANNSYARCNGAPISGTYVEYTPRAGYEGSDSFRFEVTFSDGERRVLSPDMLVRPPR